MEKIIGIDLGTCLSEIAHRTEAGVIEIIPNRDGDLKTHSIVSVAGEKHIVGKGAWPDLITSPTHVIRCSKRHMCEVTESGKPIPITMDPKGREITPVDIAADIIGDLKESAEQYLGCTIRKGVVTVPAHFTPVGRTNTQAAARIAGLEVKILEEPVAAALAYGLEKGRNERVAVVDYGGGTLDISVIETEDEHSKVCVTDGEGDLGGVNADEAVLGYMIEEGKKDGIEISAEKNLSDFYLNLDRAREAKEMLSRRDEVVVIVEGEGKRKPVTLTRDIFRRIMLSNDERFIACCKRIYQKMKKHGKKIDRVLLVGGSCRQVHVPDMVRDVFGIEPSRDANPDFMVVTGAAIWAVKCFGDGSEAILTPRGSQLVKDIAMQTVLSHAICVAARRNLSGSDTNEYNCCVVPANTPLPYEFRERFAPVDPRSSSVVVKFVSGQPKQLSDECPVLHEVRVPIRPSDEHADRIIVEGKINEEGIVNITVKDELLDKPVTDSFVHTAGLTKAEIDQKRKEFEQDRGV
jgi:molecular chaperone DnaK